ncbi:MAG: imidazole glycerol phosphate synthase subunit HisH [Armatimonadetes bacterium]|nr:imidazole glycerol phosphate synthase subunit HisH [Armatimonadota bacterium]
MALIDYGAGNLRSVARALARAGANAALVSGPDGLRGADIIMVPGVGAFASAMRRLRAAGLVEPIGEAARAGTPLIGLCLGMQLLFDESGEGGQTQGFGLLAGKVIRLPAGVKVPHMGWNTLEARSPDPLFDGLAEPIFVYFVHSYVVAPDDPRTVVAETTHGVRFPVIVRAGTVWGLQFHPEKSSRTGATLLRNLLARVTAERASA